MKRLIFATLSIFALAATTPVFAANQRFADEHRSTLDKSSDRTEPQQETQQETTGKQQRVDFHKVRQENLNSLNPRFEKSHNERLNALNPRFEKSRQRMLLT